MGTTLHTFQTPNPVRLRVEMPKGRIRVIAEETETTGVELSAADHDITAHQWIAEAEVAQHGDEIVVLVPRHGLQWFGFGGDIEATIHLPSASAAKLALGSGKIETSGQLGDVEAAAGSGTIRLAETAEARAHTGSGAISIGSATGSVDVKTGSGEVTIGSIGGDARVTTASGNANIGECAGAASIKTASGSLEVGEAGESVKAFSASGNIEVRRADHGRISAKTVSGRVSVGVARDTAAWLDIHTLSGRVNSALDSGPAPADGEKRVELRLSTVSGNVNVARC